LLVDQIARDESGIFVDGSVDYDGLYLPADTVYEVLLSVQKSRLVLEQKVADNVLVSGTGTAGT
jgi:hypothetical protein